MKVINKTKETKVLYVAPITEGSDAIVTKEEFCKLFTFALKRKKIEVTIERNSLLYVNGDLVACIDIEYYSPRYGSEGACTWNAVRVSGKRSHTYNVKDEATFKKAVAAVVRKVQKNAAKADARKQKVTQEANDTAVLSAILGANNLVPSGRLYGASASTSFKVDSVIGVINAHISHHVSKGVYRGNVYLDNTYSTLQTLTLAELPAYLAKVTVGVTE